MDFRDDSQVLESTESQLVTLIKRYAEEHPHLKTEPPGYGEISAIIEYVIAETGQAVVKSYVSKTLKMVRETASLTDEEVAQAKRERNLQLQLMWEQRKQRAEAEAEARRKEKEQRAQKLIEEAAAHLDQVNVDLPGFVYIFHAVGSDRYKIGISSDPAKRLSGFNDNQPPYPIKSVLAIFVANMGQVEKILHDKYASSRVHGEWFRFSKSELTEVVMAAAAFVGNR